MATIAITHSLRVNASIERNIWTLLSSFVRNYSLFRLHVITNATNYRLYASFSAESDKNNRASVPSPIPSRSLALKPRTHTTTPLFIPPRPAEHLSQATTNHSGRHCRGIYLDEVPRFRSIRHR